MKNADLISKLRRVAGNPKTPDHIRTLTKMAAQQLTRLTDELAEERYRHDRLQDFTVARCAQFDALAADVALLAKGGEVCDICIGSISDAACEDNDYHCSACAAPCGCKNCVTGENFRWRGAGGERR